MENGPIDRQRSHSVFEDIGPLFEYSIPAGETLYLRRGVIVSIHKEAVGASRKLPKTSRFIFNLLNGLPYRVNAWSGARDIKLIADRKYLGRVVAIPVKDGVPVYIKFGHYLGHKGELTFHATRMAKKEIWYMTRASGTGVLFVKIPGGFTVQDSSEGLRVDTDHLSTIIGEISGTGRGMKEIADIVKLGEMEFVDVEGDFITLLQHDFEADTGGGGIIGGIFDFFK